MVLEGRNVSLRGRCKESDNVKIVAGAVCCGGCQNVGRRVSFEGLRFTWQVQGIRTMDAMFWGRRARFLRRVAFSELELQGQFSWQAQYFWNIFPFSRKSRRKRSFWKSGASVFEEVSHKTLVLEVRSFSFRGSLAQNARFGAPDLQFSRKSRTKRSFWSSGSSVFEEVSHKTLVLEVRILVFEEVSHKTLVLEVRIFSFRGSLAQNARFGSPEL